MKNEILREILTDPHLDNQVLLREASNPRLVPDLLGMIVQHPNADGDVLFNVVSNPATTSEILLEILKHQNADSQILFNIVQKNAATQEILLKIVKHQKVNNTILLNIASSKRGKSEVLLEIVKHRNADRITLSAVVKRNSVLALTSEILLEILQHRNTDGDILSYVASNPAVNSEVLLEIVKHRNADGDTLSEVARHREVTPEILFLILNHLQVNQYILREVTVNPIATPEILLKILNQSNHPELWINIANHRSATSEVLSKLLYLNNTMSSQEVLRTIAKKISANPQVLLEVLDCQEPLCLSSYIKAPEQFDLLEAVHNYSISRNNRISVLHKIFSEEHLKNHHSSKLPYVFNLPSDVINYILTFNFRGRAPKSGEQKREVYLLDIQLDTKDFRLVSFSDYSKSIARTARITELEELTDEVTRELNNDVESVSSSSTKLHNQ